MADGSPGAELVLPSPYGPLFGLVVRIRELATSGQHHEALAAADVYEWVAEAFGDRRTVDFVIQRRMYTYLFMEQYEPALAVGETLIARHRAAGNRLGEAKTLADLAELCVFTGRLMEGMRYLARAGLLLESTTARNDRYVSALSSYGDAATAAGLYEVAAAFYEEFYATNGPEEDAYFETVYTALLVSWGLWLDHLGHTSEAGQRLRRAAAVAAGWLDMYADSGDGKDIQSLTAVRALVLAKLGAVDEAEHLAVRVIVEMGRDHRHRPGGGWMAHTALALAWRARGDVVAARRELLAAQYLVRHAGSTDVSLLLNYELAALNAQAVGADACTDLTAALREQTGQLWRQRRQRMTMLHQARRHEELEVERADTRRALLRDPLTGLGNRRHFDQMISAIQDGAVDPPLSLLLIDVDKFKAINDTHSHSAGDRVLRDVAAIISTHCRAGSDVPIRYAGDEFTVFLKADLATAIDLAERIRGAVAATSFAHIAPGTPVSISTGVATLGPGMTGTRLFHAADTQLYEAKRGGRDRVAA